MLMVRRRGNADRLIASAAGSPSLARHSPAGGHRPVPVTFGSCKPNPQAIASRGTPPQDALLAPVPSRSTIGIREGGSRDERRGSSSGGGDMLNRWSSGSV